MARTGSSYKTNNDDYFEPFDGHDMETESQGRQPRFGFLLIVGFSLAAALGVVVAFIH